MWGGAALVATSFGGFNYALGGRFLFFLPSLQTGYQLAKQPNPWALPLHAWLPSATWLYLPGAVAAASLLQAAWWISRPTSRPGGLRFYLHAQLVGQLLLFSALEASGRAPVLQFSYYSDLLFPATFLALGDHFRGLTAVGRDRRTAVAAVVLLIGSLVFPTALTSLLARLGPVPLVVLPLAGCVALLVSRASGASSLGAGATVALLAAFNCTVRDGGSLPDSLPFSSARKQVQTETRHERLAVLRTVAAAVRAIQQHDRGGGGCVWFWYDPKSPLASVYTMTASTHLCRVVNRQDSTTGGIQEHVAAALLHPGTKLAVLGSMDEPLDCPRKALAEKGVGVELLFQGPVGKSPAAYRLTLLQTYPLAEPGQSSGRRLP